MTEGSESAHNTPQEILPDGVCGDVLSNAADVVITVESGTIQTVVDHGEQTLGYQPAQLVGESLSSLFATDTRPSPLFDVRSLEEFESTTAAVETVIAPFEAADGSVVALSLRHFTAAERSEEVFLGRDMSDEMARVREHQSRADVLDSIADPLYVLDVEGRFEQVNDALVAYTGYERAELLGRETGEILSARDAERATDKSVDEPESGPATFEVTVLTKAGERILTEAHVATLTADGRQTGSVGVLRDIRERKHRELNLELLKQVLTRVFRHNFRNELMVAKARAEVLAGSVDEELQEYTDRILEAADRLQSHTEKARLIEQVIETRELYEFDFTETVATVVETVREEYPEATIDVEMPETAVVDANPHTPKAIRELLENAIEHAPDGSEPYVDIWLDQQDGTRTLFVEDESGGLADHEITVLEQEEESDLEHSSGVGLWLIRWLVEYSDAEMIVHRTAEGSLLGIRFSQQTTDELATDISSSALTRTPAQVREVSPQRFQGETVVGRVGALNELEDIYDALAGTGGHSVLVTGEAGIGKTTLVEQFRDQLAVRDTAPVIATGVCESAVQPSYHAFRQVMAELPTERDISDILTDVESAISQDSQQRELFAEIADELRRVATEQSVVLFLEDMHWADQGTIDLFEHLLRDVGQWSHPVMFVGTYRTSDIDQSHPVLEIAETTAEAGRGTVIDLEPFGETDIEALLSSLLDVEELPESFVESVCDHTGGTPLFVNELGRHLVDTLGPVQSGTDLPESLDGVSLPETVESAITERLDALPEEVRPVLELGAVIGEEFSFDLLREASDRPVDDLVECSNTLVRRQVWEQTSDGIAFVHGVVRDQTLELIDEAETLHASVARAIERVHGDTLEKHTGQLARHYEAVGAYETAFEYNRQAGEYAAETYALEDALEYYEQARSLAREHGIGENTVIATLQAEIGRIRSVLGDMETASEAIREGLAIAPADDEQRCRLLAVQTEIQITQSAFEQAGETARRQRELASACEAPILEADAIAQLGQITRRQGEYEQAREHFERALEIRKAVGDRAGEARNRNNLGTVLMRRGEYDRARECFDESLDRFREIGDRGGERRALTNLGTIAKDRGEYERASESHERALQIAREIGDRSAEATCLYNLGIVARARSEYDQARSYFERSLDIDEQLGDRREQVRRRSSLGYVAKDQGEYEQACEYFERALEIAQAIGARGGEANSLFGLGYVKTDQGQYDRAQEYLERSLAIRRDIGDRRLQADSLGILGVVMKEQGEYDRAEEYLSASLDQGVAIDSTIIEIVISRELAAVARERGEYDSATRYLDRSLAECDEAEEPIRTANTRLERARLALARGETQSAQTAAAQAHSTLTDIGAPHDEGRALSLRGRIAAASGSPDDAREHWQEALATFEDIGAPQDTLDTLGGLVDVCREQGDDEQAAQYRERARTVFENAPEPVQTIHEEWLDC